MKIIDVCSGSRMMWFNKINPHVIFGDLRNEEITVPDASHKKDGTRLIKITPDVQFDFRNLPYADASFSMVVFDPPHLVRAGPKSWLAAKYGKLAETWQEDMRKGFAECFRILKPDGVLIFKWNETQIKVSEILSLTAVEPLFGHKSGKRQDTHWICFMKMTEVSEQ